MPLSKARNRERMRKARAGVQPTCNLNTGQVVQPIPLYNPAIHRAGDTVLIKQGKRWIQTTIPKLDAGGQPIPDFD